LPVGGYQIAALLLSYAHVIKNFVPVVVRRDVVKVEIPEVGIYMRVVAAPLDTQLVVNHALSHMFPGFQCQLVWPHLELAHLIFYQLKHAVIVNLVVYIVSEANKQSIVLYNCKVVPNDTFELFMIVDGCERRHYVLTYRFHVFYRLIFVMVVIQQYLSLNFAFLWSQLFQFSPQS